MRICRSCGRENADETDFCECGEYLRWEPTNYIPAVAAPARSASAPVSDDRAPVSDDRAQAPRSQIRTSRWRLTPPGPPAAIGRAHRVRRALPARMARARRRPGRPR